MLNCSRKIEWIKFWMRYSRHHAQQKSVAFLFLSLYIDRSSAIIVSYGSYSFCTIFFINKIDKEWRKTNKIPFFFSFDRTTSHFICYHTKRAHLISSLTQFIFMIFFLSRSYFKCKTSMPCAADEATVHWQSKSFVKFCLLFWMRSIEYCPWVL